MHETKVQSTIFQKRIRFKQRHTLYEKDLRKRK